MPLKLIFEIAVEEKKISGFWKIVYVVPVHKKDEKGLLKRYLPIKLVLIFSKSLKELSIIFCLTILSLTPSQSCFLPADSCIAPLLSIIPEMHTNFDDHFMLM